MLQFEVYETVYPTNGRSDMFWDQGLADVNTTFLNKFCSTVFGEGALQPGGRRVAARALPSVIKFSKYHS